MAVTVKLETSQGEKRQVYVRLIVVEATNHGVPARALFRSFASRRAFVELRHYIDEYVVEFMPDVSKPIWVQAYHALKLQPGFEGAVDDDNPPDLTNHVAALEGGS